MTKRHALTIAAIVIVGSVVAIKSFMLATSMAATPQSATSRTRTVATSQPATMAIVPAPAIDPTAEVFIGTGDGSVGSWVRP
jgi:hypothetical protein